MGLLDLVLGRKMQASPKKEAISPLLSRNTVHTFSSGEGRFGWDATNPIPCAHMFSSEGAEKYLTWLKWQGDNVVAERFGSVGVAGMPGMVDQYRISVGMTDLGSIYICSYMKENSLRLPKGFGPSSEYLLDSGVVEVLGPSGKTNVKYLKRLLFNMIDAVGKERANQLDIDWTLFTNLIAYFDSTKALHNDVEGCCERIYPRQFRPDDLKRLKEIAAIPTHEIQHEAVT